MAVPCCCLSRRWSKVWPRDGLHRFPLCYLGSGNWFWASIVLNSVAKVASLDSELLLPHKDVKSMGGCLAIWVTFSWGALTIAVNLLSGGGKVSSLLRVVGPVYWLVICSPEFLGRVRGVSLVEFVNLTVFFFVVPWPNPRFGVVDWHAVVRKVGLTI